MWTKQDLSMGSTKLSAGLSAPTTETVSGIPRWSSCSDSPLSLLKVQVQSVVGQLKCHKACGTVQKKTCHFSHIPHNQPGQEVTATPILARSRESDLSQITQSIDDGYVFQAQVWLTPKLALPIAWCCLFARRRQGLGEGT